MWIPLPEIKATYSHPQEPPQQPVDTTTGEIKAEFIPKETFNPIIWYTILKV